MSFRLVEVHLPGHDFDKVNALPHEYHGVFNILNDSGIYPLTSIIVSYSTQNRDELIQAAKSKRISNITYTGTYGELPSENLDEFLVGSNKQWDIIIAGRYWGACHYSSYAHIISEIRKRNPQHVNFHFIMPLIDGVNKKELTEIENGYGTYSTDAFHTALIFRTLLDGEVKHIQVKTTKWRINQDGSECTIPEFPSSRTSIDLHFWTSLKKMIDEVKRGNLL